MLTLTAYAETWAIATDDDPSLMGYVSVALSLRGQRGCRADAWHHLVSDLLARNLPCDVFDAAVDVLHYTAVMPCVCPYCITRAGAVDAAVSRAPKLLPLSASAINARVRARYDQTGRYRIRYR